MLHIRYQGRTHEWPLRDFDIGNLSTDEDIKAVAISQLEIPPAKIRDYEVERPASGDIVIRPPALFG